MILLSKMLKTDEAESLFLAKMRRIAQKSGDFIISFRSAPGRSVQITKPLEIISDVCLIMCCGRFAMVWSKECTLMKSKF